MMVVIQGIDNHTDMVLHKCHNRCCVNPDHLYFGDHEDNMRDRAASGNSKGIRNGRSKLSDVDVREIRRIYAVGELSQNGLAARFKIGQSTISEILLGKKWTHVK